MDTYTLEHYVHSKLKEARAASARAALAAAARAEQPPSGWMRSLIRATRLAVGFRDPMAHREDSDLAPSTPR